MKFIFDFLSKIGDSFSEIAMSVFAVLLLFILVLAVFTKFLRIRLQNKGIGAIILKLSKLILKIFVFIDSRLLSKKGILIGAVVCAILGALAALSSKSSFGTVIFSSLIIPAIWLFGTFLLKLSVKGLTVGLGSCMDEMGDHDSYEKAVRDVGGKFIVYEDEDPNQYPDDLVTFGSGTRAEADARNAENTRIALEKAQRERLAQRNYLDARNRYQTAATHYRGYAAKDPNSSDALRWKAEMDQALVDMNRSGYSGQ